MNQRGFTLIELVIVMAIVSMLAGLAVPRLLQAQDNAALLKTRLDLTTIDGAIAACIMSKGIDKSGISLAQLATDGFLPFVPKPPHKIAGLKSSDQYAIDASSGRAYVMLNSPGKTICFFSDTDLYR